MIVATGMTGTLGQHLPKSVISINLDLRSDFNLRDFAFAENIDAVIHLAGIVGNKAVEADLSKSRSVNIEGTKRLGRQIYESGKVRFIYVSSSHVYKPSESLLLESSDVAPATSYGYQKLEAEQGLRRIFNEEPERLCIVRVFSVLDWGMPKDSLGGAAQRLLETGGRFPIANSDDKRDFLLPSQVSEALFSIAKKESINGIFNLCSGKTLTVASALRKMFEKFPEIDISSSLIPGNSTIPIISGSNTKLLLTIPDLNLTWCPIC